MIISTFSNTARLLPRQPSRSSSARREGTPSAPLTCPRPQHDPPRRRKTTATRTPARQASTSEMAPWPVPLGPAALLVPSVVPATPVGLKSWQRLQRSVSSRQPRLPLACSKPLHGGGSCAPRARLDLSRAVLGRGQTQRQAGSVLPAPGPGG